jgi:hypothetical protein
MAQSVSSSVDNYPPSRITDLFVVDVQNNPETNVTIQFTAPGEDLDFGTGIWNNSFFNPFRILFKFISIAA